MKKESINEYVGYVYKIVNKVNNKVYIGETLKSLNIRFKQHLQYAYYKKYWNFYFYRAIRKYGSENFEIYELYREVNFDRKVLKENILKLEEFYIKEFDSYKSGYNSNSGGRHPLEVSLNTRALQRKRKLDNIITTRENLKKARSFYDNRKKVTAYNYDTGEILNKFDSIKDGANYYHVDISGIIKVCKKIKNYLGKINNIKITWRYEEDKYEIPYKVKVFNIDGILLNKFITFADAARFYNIKCQETITRCCEGKMKSTGRAKKDKLIWRYINDDFIL